MNSLDKFFKISERNSSLQTEILAGMTTFFATSYVILVNPRILSNGDPQILNGVLFATCIGAAVGSLLIALLANIPFAQAPGMGLSAFFTFTVMPTIVAMSGNPDLSNIQAYQRALPLVFVSGIIFIVITFIGLREAVINGIPKNIKIALSGGIGLFITYLGLQSSHIIVASPATQVQLINFADFANNAQNIMGALIALFGVIVIGALYSLRIKGSILFGILASTLLSYIIGYSKIPENFAFNLADQASDWVNVSLFKMDFVGLATGPDQGFIWGTITALILAFFMVNMFDSLGTLIGAARAANMIDEKTGEIQGLRMGLLSDSISTAVGACLGTSTVTTVVESSAGIGEGGRTGLSGVVAAGLFLLSLFFAPFIVLIPMVATAPALIFVGCLMLAGIRQADFEDMTEAIPAFLTIIMMPLTYSIANGIAFGLISYVLLKTLTGKFKQIKLTTIIVSVLFVIRLAMGV